MAIEFRSGINLLGQLATAIGANLSSGKLLGRSSAGSGSIEEISIGSNLTLSGGVLSAAAGGVNGYVAGNWVLPYGNMSITSGNALISNTITYTAFVVSKTITVDAIGARITLASAGNNLQLAIYGSDANRLPTGTPLASTGNLSTATAAAVSSSVTPFTLVAGEIYYGAVNTSGGPQMAAQIVSSANALSNYGGISTLSTLAGGSNSACLSVTTSQAFGTWPNVTSMTRTVSVNAASCVVYIRVASIP